ELVGRGPPAEPRDVIARAVVLEAALLIPFHLGVAVAPGRGDHVPVDRLVGRGAEWVVLLVADHARVLVGLQPGGAQVVGTLVADERRIGGAAGRDGLAVDHRHPLAVVHDVERPALGARRAPRALLA